MQTNMHLGVIIQLKKFQLRMYFLERTDDLRGGKTSWLLGPAP